MEQRLRLLQGGHPRAERRGAERHRLAVPAQIVWKDARGATRMMAVMTRDISDSGVSVECAGGTPIPVFRLVHFQIVKEARMRPDLPAVLRKGSVLSAVFRVGPCLQATGAPAEYALRLLIEPAERAAAAPVEDDSQTRTA
jgi:hypothetical protein